MPDPDGPPTLAKPEMVLPDGDPGPSLEVHVNVADSREERYAAAERVKDEGRLADAVALLQDAVAEDPTFDLAFSALAAWCTRLDRHAEAVGYARKVCELKPLDPFSFTALSVACVRAGMILEAEDAMARSRALQG